MEILIPERFRAKHPKHRTDYAVQPRVRSMGAGLELTAGVRTEANFQWISCSVPWKEAKAGH